MTHLPSRRWFLTAGTALLGSAVTADPMARSLRPVARPRNLGRSPAVPAGEALVRAAQLPGVVGYALLDLRSGQVLEDHVAAASLPPASVTKAVTALYALEALGEEHRFATRVLATGGVRDGVVQGDLILAGGGDPTLDTDQLARLAKSLREAGIHEVRGGFRVWGGALPFARGIDRSQPDHVGYNPAVSGLNLNFNRVHFEWKRQGGAWRITMDARSRLHRAEVEIARMSVAKRAAPIYAYRDKGGHDSWSVASGALGKGGARWLPVRKPELYAGEVFATFARSNGIILKPARVLRSLPRGAHALAQVQSAPLRDLVQAMLKYSTNLTAEVLGLAATTARRGKPSSIATSARVMTNWARSTLGMGRGSAFVDHSGLGDRSRITAIDMARGLQRARTRFPIRALLKEIPMRDEGRRTIKGHPVRVQAKTGTLNFVSTLAGYLTAADGRELVFAIFMADTRRRAAIPRAQKERPPGAQAYNTKAKKLQQRLMQRWGEVYDAS